MSLVRSDEQEAYRRDIPASAVILYTFDDQWNWLSDTKAHCTLLLGSETIVDLACHHAMQLFVDISSL